MKKRSTSNNLSSKIILIIAVITLFFALENIILIILEASQYRAAINLKPEFFKKSSSTTVSSFQGTISYEEKQKLLKLFPEKEINVKAYYTMYGKNVLEDEEKLDLTDVKIDENLTSHLKILTSLKEVDLRNQNMTKDEKIALQTEFPNIKFRWMVDVLGENYDCNVEKLDLSRKKITDLADFKKSLTLLTNLKKLDLSNTNLKNEELGALREEFQDIRIDWVVHMSKWSVRTDAVAFSVLVYDYNYRRMTTEDIQVLKYCTELQALDLGHQAIQDITVIGEYLPELRVLILADNKIKDISPLANLKHLHYLELFMNDITDSTPLASCKELVDLNISFNYRFADVSGIMDLPLLERLWLISDRISTQSYNEIRQKYPNVKLVTTGVGSTNSGWRTHERYFAMIDMYKNNYISEVFLKYDNK